MISEGGESRDGVKVEAESPKVEKVDYRIKSQQMWIIDVFNT